MHSNEEKNIEKEINENSKNSGFFGDIFSFLTMTILITIVVLGSVFLIKGSTNLFASSFNENKKDLFEQNKVFVCQKILWSNKYLVSKKSGWSVYKEYFKKDDTLVDIIHCEKKSNQ